MQRENGLKVVHIDEIEKWNSIVRSFSNYDVYYLAGYLKAFYIHGDGEPILFHYETEDIKILNVAMKREIKVNASESNDVLKTQFYDLSTVYGYGGPLIEGVFNKTDLIKFDEEYIAKCQEMNIVSEVIRFHPVLENYISFEGVYEIVELGKTITMDITEVQNILKNMDAKNRNMIRKAQKNNVHIYWGRSPELIVKFKTMYESTMERDQATPYYFFKDNFYSSVLNDLKHNCLIFYAIYNYEIIAMSMILFSNAQIHYHLSASDNNFRNLGATNLLLYEVANWGHSNQFKTFHLGGGLGSKEDNLYKFKKVFNKKSKTVFKIGKKIFLHDAYSHLVDLRTNESKE
ncbi:GNAT family N-acetyltransferase, partial [Exiguobacterium sp. AM39-5BH]|uniref:GNAT family N-acetyltransferase n=1 Tax=Exiguobacterium sp. AM39-5BH TaxID=2292355 RepID=UPI000FE192C8